MVPEKVIRLVERFDANIADYKQGKYNEAQTRQEYINPLFQALGWDMENTQGYAEAYKEVIHEDAVKVGRATKAPDYSFRIGGVRKFFVEAKKPSVVIKDDVHPAYQLRRYAWSAKLPLSILTDFEEFAVYDCRLKPEKTDKASTARIMYLTYPEYARKWDELTNIFSKEAILKGAFDRYAESNKAKKGTAEVDVAFLQEIERWRDLLARNLALRNPQLTRRDLNFAVQRTIDRIIFLRICEDRGIEEYGRLMALQNGERVYQRLLTLFYQADDRYNSGIFHFKTERDHPEPHDTLTPNLQLDDTVLKDIFKNLYYPDSPYEFSVLPADILGQVYEQFLGKVIRLTAGHQAKVEEKPEVKKAGGVYYTPTYIVEYIVKQTVGELLKDKTPKQVETLTILDPACGSGSFLIGAYQYLLDWYRDQYLLDPQKWSKGRQPRLYQVSQHDWKLTIDERKRILLSHIYGVDIDAQAVEVTKLSLLLKVLEGEDEQTISSQMSLFQQRVLPDLSNNIKCGNSLIRSDFYVGKQITFDEEELYRVNAFDWDREFPEIMQAGGFDVVIGNPPYGAVFTKDANEYLKEKYQTSVLRGESYLLFIEQMFQLLRIEGLFGFIVPDTYLNLGFTESLRQYLLQNSILREIVLLPSKVFGSATVDTTLLFLEKATPVPDYHKARVNIQIFDKKTMLNAIEQPNRQFEVGTDLWYEQKVFNIGSNESEAAIIRKVESNNRQLHEIAEMFSGVKAYEVGKGMPPQTPEIRDTKPFTSTIQVNAEWQPFYNGKDIARCQLLWENNSWIHYGAWLAAPREPENFKDEKILIRKIVGQTLIATYIPYTSYCNTLLFILKMKDSSYSYHYLLGILNSRLIGWYFRKKFQINPDDTFPQIMIRDILQFPIPNPEFSSTDQMVELVQQMLDLHKQLSDARMLQVHTLLQRQIDATDRQIDQLVYELYGLTDEEIKIVEAGS